MFNFFKLFSIIFVSMFASGSLVVSLIVVPIWGEMQPAEVLDWFSNNGMKLGMVMFPMEIIGTVFSLLALGYSVKKRFESRIQWALASIFMILTIVLLPIHFAEANYQLMQQSIDLGSVNNEIYLWGVWNWVRVALTFIALFFAVWGSLDRVFVNSSHKLNI